LLLFLEREVPDLDWSVYATAHVTDVLIHGRYESSESALVRPGASRYLVALLHPYRVE